MSVYYVKAEPGCMFLYGFECAVTPQGSISGKEILSCEVYELS